MRLYDKVRYHEDGKWILSGLIMEILDDKYIVIDTLISGAYKVPISGVSPMPEPKGTFIIKSESITDKGLKSIREKFKAQSISSFKTPILTDWNTCEWIPLTKKKEEQE